MSRILIVLIMFASTLSFAEDHCFNFQKTFERMTKSKVYPKIAIGLAEMSTEPRGKNTVLFDRMLLDQFSEKFGFTGHIDHGWSTVVDQDKAGQLIPVRLEQEGCKYVTVIQPDGKKIAYEIVDDRHSRTENVNIGLYISDVLWLKRVNSSDSTFSLDYSSQKLPDERAAAESMMFPAGEMTFSLDHDCGDKKITETQTVRVSLSLGVNGGVEPSVTAMSSSYSGMVYFATSGDLRKSMEEKDCKKLAETNPLEAIIK